MADQLELKSFDLKGFKSFDAEGQTIMMTPITVMLGANGAGKSNLVSFFKMINYMTTGELQGYVARQGYADALMYFGAKATSEISARLRFESSTVKDEYNFELGSDAAGLVVVTHNARTSPE